MGKNIILIANNIVNNVERTLFLLIIGVEMICPTIAHTIETTITIIPFVGVLFIISIPISNIFCPTAVEIARKTPIGIR
ncbi:TPA: hypothetical protein DIC40_04605 [Patescibacteria group bacterium]|nr:hypothetical protein [Candidatus Gracilibacteria bacterium]